MTKKCTLFLIVLFSVFFCNAQKRGGQVEDGPTEKDGSAQPANYLALVIGTEEYDASSNWASLSNPVFDAEKIGEVLKNDYGFDVTLLKNPTKTSILDNISDLRRQFAEGKYNDNTYLLIFIAGHGGWDDNISGFIVPKDAKSGSEDKYRQTYITHSDLRQMIENIKAPHTLVLIDACFGGTFDQKISKSSHRGENDEYSLIDWNELISRKESIKCAKYITSGGKVYVPDGRPNHHSPFASQIIEELTRSYDSKTPVTFHRLNTAVELLSPEPCAGEFADNQPGGDFVLIPNSLRQDSKTSSRVKERSYGVKPVEPERNQTNAQPKTFTLSGSVVDDETSAPINNAAIRANGQITHSASDGRFAFSDLSPGAYPLSLSATGYATVSYNASINGADGSVKVRMVKLADNRTQTTATDVEKPIEPTISSPIALVRVEGGTFQMGDASMRDAPVHKVTLSSFYIGKTEVTQKQWREIMDINPSFHKDCDDCPVETVSYDDILSYLDRLNAKYPGHGYRLPTEAEWEYAARGGNKGHGYPWAGASTQIYLKAFAWFRDNYDNIGTHPVGTKKPNELGLFDMLGNVWERCSDWFSPYSLGPVNNPKGPATGDLLVQRGGDYNTNAEACYTTYR